MDTKLMLVTAAASVLLVEWLLPTPPPADPYSYPPPPAWSAPAETRVLPTRTPMVENRRPARVEKPVDSRRW